MANYQPLTRDQAIAHLASEHPETAAFLVEHFDISPNEIAVVTVGLLPHDCAYLVQMIQEESDRENRALDEQDKRILAALVPVLTSPPAQDPREDDSELAGVDDDDIVREAHRRGLTITTADVRDEGAH